MDVAVTTQPVQVENILKANITLKEVVYKTPLMRNMNLSEKHEANILLKREDLQVVRSYKIRGAYNKISSLTKEEKKKGIVCASAGNHAQGVAYACKALEIHGVIFMPAPTPSQKVEQVKMFGKEFVEVVLTGDTFDDSFKAAKKYQEEQNSIFIHPFDDEKVIEGQGTVAIEILEETQEPVDFLILPIGGGGLCSGVGSYFKQISPNTKIIGVEPLGAPSMTEALANNAPIELAKIDKFVDGAAVQRIGDRTFEIGQQVLDEVLLIPEGKICTTILKLYNKDAIVVEPAGALSVAALDQVAEKYDLKGKNVVCVVSGSNNDITRMEEIKERSLLYEGLKHYFIIRFPQRAGALRDFLNNVLGPKDDIVHFEYSKKINREKGPAVVGIELQDASDYAQLLERMDKEHIVYEKLNENADLFNFLI